MQKCPKCGYQRSELDDPEIPDYRCPACGIVYKKYLDRNKPKETEIPAEKPKKKVEIIGGIILMTWLAIMIIANKYKDPAPRPKPITPPPTITHAETSPLITPEPKPKEKNHNECREDSYCAGKTAAVHARQECKRRIEAQAKFDVKWSKDASGWLGPDLFTAYMWKDNTKKQIIAIGEKAMFQNGFGAWVPIKYYCMINIIDNTVADIAIGQRHR